ncbi:MAG: polymer-forming cytoskeletal protein [Candidatus Marinimicrobia bacterium]|nr:polymer-forming cytoskeletal protein [Candidatus Neomarinimicrobiota bacterium]
MKEKPTYTIIGDDTEIKGDIFIKGSIMIAGKIDGNITADETVSVTAGSIVNGMIKASDVYVSGTVLKGVHASGKVVLGSDSKLEGPLKAARLIIEEGAQYSGLCTMIEGKEKQDDAEKKE